MAEYPFTEEGVTAALDALGDDQFAVAAAFARLGIDGQQHRCGTCPTAVYLLGLWPLKTVDVDRSRVLAEMDEVRVVDGYTEHDHWRVAVETPWPVADFIAAFDAGHYPDLIRRTTP